jgi:hypothetical protein
LFDVCRTNGYDLDLSACLTDIDSKGGKLFLPYRGFFCIPYLQSAERGGAAMRGQLLDQDERAC